MACELNAFANLELSVAMTAQDDRILGKLRIPKYLTAGSYII